MKSVATRKFWERYQQLPDSVRSKARQVFRLFTTDPSHPSLHFERLRCDPKSWSVRITREYRAVGARQGDTMVWYWVGNHREFDRAFPV